MKKIIVLIVFIILLVGCNNNDNSNNNNDNNTNNNNKIKEALTLDQIIESDNYILLDVRTNEEYNESHLVDSINIPYDTINEETQLDKTKYILVYCRSGNRSNIAKNTLENLGYNVYDLGAFDNIDLPKE